MLRLPVRLMGSLSQFAANLCQPVVEGLGRRDLSRGQMSPISLVVTSWSAWKPGVTDRADWLLWAKHAEDVSTLDSDSVAPPAPNIASSLRRRLSSLGRMAVSVAAPMLSREDGQPVNIPCVLCSRHGELTRTVGLLESLAKGEGLSPAYFSLSVHNAIGGVLSIAQGNIGNITAIATVEDEISAALLEAAALLNDSDCKQVLCVIYDEPVPSEYAEFEAAPSEPYAVAIVFASPDSIDTTEKASSVQIDLDTHLPSTGSTGTEPQALQLLRFILAPREQELLLAGRRQSWRARKVVGDGI